MVLKQIDGGDAEQVSCVHHGSLGVWFVVVEGIDCSEGRFVDLTCGQHRNPDDRERWHPAGDSFHSDTYWGLTP